jgi:hypothetical protein
MLVEKLLREVQLAALGNIGIQRYIKCSSCLEKLSNVRCALGIIILK